MELPELSTVLSVLAYYLIHSWGYSHQGLGSLVTPFYRGENCTGQPCDPACRALHQCTPAGAVTGRLPGSRAGPLSSAEPDRPGGITALGSGGQSSSWLVTPRPEDSLCRGAQAYPPPTPPHTHMHTRAHTHTHTHTHTHMHTLAPRPPRPLSSLPLPPARSPCSPGRRHCLGGGPGLSPALQALLAMFTALLSVLHMETLARLPHTHRVPGSLPPTPLPTSPHSQPCCV